MTTELPKGWVRTTLRALGTWTSGGTPRRSQPAYFGGTIPWVKTGDLQDSPVSTIPESLTEAGVENSSAKVFPPGTLLVAMYGATIGKLGVLIRPAATNQACAALLPSDANQELLPFTFYYLLSQRRALRRSGQGGAQPNISQTVIKGWEIPLAPLPEQRRIVAAIEQHFSRLDAAVVTLERVKAKLGQTRASVLKAAVEGRLVPTEAALAREEGRDYEHASVLLERILAERRKKHDEAQVGAGRKKKYTEPVEPDVEGLPALPEGWVWATMMQVVQGGRPICYGVLKAGPHHPGGVPLVRVTDVVRGDLSVKLLKHCNPEREAVFARARLATGDLVVSKDGTIGRVAVVPPALDGANVTQHVLRVAVQQVADAYYVMTALRSPRAQAWMKGETKGVALQGVNVGDFRRLPIPIPPLAEQHRIVAEVDRQLSVLDEVGRVVDTNLARCARLRQSILKRAFEGRLVPQDPDDEPASALLDRIKAQVAATPKQTTRRRKSRKGTA